MRGLLVVALVLAAAIVVPALPVKEKKEEHKEEEQTKPEEGTGEDWELSLEYGRYLKEVVQALESDPAFRKKLETAEVDDIKSGKIARELHFVDHNVRTQLDELKRRELERLRHLAIKEHEKEIGVDRNLLKVPTHIDHKNPTRFEVEDLKKLIVRTTEDLEKVDQQRHGEFKTYEMEKEFERQQELKAMDEEHRKTAEVHHQEDVQKHAQHEKLHHPGSKQQLEEVWEEQDHMKAEDFNPNTFFHLHDLDGNGFWDQMEVKALFQKELDKMYDANAPEDDLTERYEEMERMREHVFKESDGNRDQLISFEEFLEQTKKSEFEQDNGWKGLDENEIYSQQEYESYQHQREEEIRQLIESGAIPPPPGYHGSPPIHPAVYQGGPYPGPHPADNVGLPPHAAPAYGVQPQAHPNAVPHHGYQAAPQPVGGQQQPQVNQQITVQQGQPQPVYGQAAPAQGGQAQPVYGQAAQAQPVYGQAAQAQPAYVQVSQGQAIPAHPAPVQPVANQPIPVQPIAGQPAGGQPVPQNPAEGQVVNNIQGNAAQHPSGGGGQVVNNIQGDAVQHPLGGEGQVVNNIQGNAIH